jgi:AraC-like DNA-binding protein
MIAPAWKALGEWDKLLAIYTEVEARMGADTLNENYATILKDRADAATAQGNTAEALDYMNRYASLQKELNRKLQESEAQELAAKYHADEQDRKIRDAQSASARKDAIIIAVLVLLLVAAAFSFHFARQRTRKEETEQPAAPAPNPELFGLIDGIIRQERLYADESLQRQDILDRFDISRRTLNDLLAVHADGQSFTAYINAMRLEDAVRLLREQPEMSLTGIAENVGFTPSTFRDQFKRQFGMTPTEYRQNL